MTGAHSRGGTASADTRSQAITICDRCGKHGYRSRAQAKKRSKKIHPGAHMSAYQCGNLWHVGVLPDVVIRGDLDRAELD